MNHTMSAEASKSCRIFIRYGTAAADSLPTEDDIRNTFSVYGNIIGMFSVMD